MKRTKATTEQIARYGHIAIAIKQAMEQQGFTTATLNEAMGKARSSPMLYNILNSRLKPSEKVRSGLVKALALDESLLMERPLQSVTPGTGKPMERPLQSVAPGAGKPIQSLPAPVQPPGANQLQLTLDASGMATMQLNLLLALPQAMELLQYLTGQNILVKPKE